MTALSDGAPTEHVARQRILRRATLYTAGFISVTVGVATAGSALIAWFLSVSGLPFRLTWIALTLIVLVVPLVGMMVGALRRSWQRRGGKAGDEQGAGRMGGTNISGAGQGIESNGG
jgi:hypothetical protein